MIVGIALQNFAWLKKNEQLSAVRLMPTPAQVGEGMTGACANDRVTKEDLDQILAITNNRRTHEGGSRASDGCSRSSQRMPPAYVFMFIEAMADAAVAQGMPRKQAYQFASQSVLGSAKMVLGTGMHPANLKTWSAPRPELPLKASAPLRKTASAAPYSKHSRQHLIKENKCNP